MPFPSYFNTTGRSLWVVRQNLKRGKMFRYIDGDGKSFSGVESTIQPSSFEKRWKLLCVLVICGFRVFGGGLKLPELCAKDHHYLVRDWERLQCVSVVEG